MPEIGRPKTSNPFANIQKAAPRKKKNDIGKELNNISGVREDSKFVDKNEHNKMGKDAFLKLLSFQLQNQDPLKPVDQKKFAGDLAQFSQLEQLTAMNKKLDSMQNNGPTEDKFFGASFLGKKVMTKGASIEYKGERKINLPFFLPQDAKQLIVRVYDKKNQMVAQVEKEGMGSGQNSITWDGLMMDNTPAAKGEYRFEVRAWDKISNEFKGETRGSGIVTDVHFEGEETLLVIDGKKKVFLRDVKSFSVPENNAHSQKLPGLKKQAADTYNQIDNQRM